MRLSMRHARHHRCRQGHHLHRSRAGFIGLLALALSVLLVGCGYSTANGAGPGGGGTGGGGSTGPTNGTTIRPCVGPYADTGVEGQPTLTLSDAQLDHTGRAHVGDLVQIQLTAAWHWSLNSTASELSPTQYAGAYDENRQLCFWNFRAQSPGTAKVSFTGSPRCEGGQPCPAIARVETFTVEVS